MKSTVSRCRSCGVVRTFMGRGCCRRCYQTHWQRVKAGQTTWVALEEAGMVSAPHPRRCRPFTVVWYGRRA